MENLFSSSTPADDSALPSYLVAADSHNIGNSLGGSWFEPATWGTKFSNAGKFIATSVLSGADSLYNSATTVGSWVGVSEGPHDTGAWISSLDDNLGEYYAQNRESVDLAGFIATSFIPGLGGIKLLNAGQTALKGAMRSGVIGGNLAKATGLLVPETQAFVQLSAREIAQSSGAVGILNNNTLKAVGAGFTQNVLEAAAFETVVQATMFKSPVLDGQDGWDIAKNIAFGGVVGGVIGGAISSAISVGTIKKLAQGELLAGKPFSSRFIAADATPADQKIILTAEARDMRPVPVELGGDAYPLGTSNAPANQKLYENAVERDNNAIRTDINSLVRGTDGTLGNAVADVLYAAPANRMMEALLNAEEIATVGTQTKVEGAFKKALKILDVDAVKNLNVRYIKLNGEGAGDLLEGIPKVLNLADTVKTSSTRSIQDAVLADVRSHKFSTRGVWDAAELTGKTSHAEAEARYIWASQLLQGIKDDTIIHANDIPLLERVRSDLQSGKSVVYKIKYADDSIGPGFTMSDLEAHLARTKEEVANKLLEKMVLRGDIPVEYGTEAIAKIVNTKQAYLEGTRSADLLSDLYAHQDRTAKYHSLLVSKGLRTEAQEPTSAFYLPQYAKVGYRNKELVDLNGNIVDGMVWLKQQQKMYQQAADLAFAKNAGNLIADSAPVISDNVLLNANLSDGGAGLVSFANGGYGSLGSYMQQVGANVTRPLKEAYRKVTAATFEGPLVSMGNKKEAAIEFDVINNKIASTTEHYVLDVEGHSGVPNALISKKIYDFRKALDAGAQNLKEPVLQKGAPEFIPVVNQETYDTIAAHISREGTRTGIRKEINAVAGKEDNKFEDIFRPIRPDPKSYPFVAFVKDPRITGAGHTSMIHASTEAELRAMVDKVPAEYKTIYKTQAEEYYKALDEFEYSRTLNENYIDTDLKSRGINSQFFPKTDPQKIVDSILQHHLRADDVTAVELVRMKYQPTFDWLEDQGKQFTTTEASRYGSSLEKVEKFGKNPYTDYTKTALDVSKASEYSLLYSANRALDEAASRVYKKVTDVWTAAKTPAELDSINGMLQKAGYNSAYYDAATDALANHTAPRGVLSKFIRGSNSILSRFVLGLDPLNALNNAIGANILRSTELKHVTDAIMAGDSKIAGELAALTRINVPGTPSTSLAPTKLIANAVRNFVQDDGTLMKQYVSEGLVKDSAVQFRDILDDFTLRGTETAAELDSRINSAFGKAKKLAGDTLDAGEKYTGNKFAEQFNRFISANVMHQITNLAKKGGVLTEAEARAYRNTFVNRVEGNTIASQRPVMFQGPIGQALGLFQSYQFNLMQQMFRYVAEGTGKDAAMLLGLQSTLYGINGMPAFNAINTHIVGNLSGNKNHTDLYDATYGILGKTAGDFLMYGIPSNIIQTNLYSRGDINPRSITIVPNQIQDVPIVSAYTKLFGSLFNSVSKVAGGGNLWESILQGVEHNGISRPLAGLAQTLQATTGNGVVFSTSNRGTILGSNDLFSFATLSRLAGGRPLDEAIINDGVYRISAYEAAQKAKREKLVGAIKASSIEGQMPDTGSIEKFAESYAATGGKQAQFNKFMLSTMKSANTSEAAKIQAQLQSPFSQKMQILMGGRNENSAAIGTQEAVEVQSPNQ